MKTVIVVLAFAIVMLANPVYAADENLWKNWGAAPYASSLGDAYKKAPQAIDGFNLPLPVKEHFKKAVLDTCKCRTTEVWLTPGMSLEQMWSGKDTKHLYAFVMQKRTVAELPVFTSPNGRSYRKGSVAETAKARSWIFAYEGKTYVLYLPYVCFNWSWTFGTPVPIPEKCVELSFNAPIGGFVRWGIASDKGPLPPSICNAQRQGDGEWKSWYGKCDDCIRSPAMNNFIREILSDKAEIYHKYLYTVTEQNQTLRFSTDIWTDVVYICLEYPDGTRTRGVYTRPQDWKGQYTLFIQDSFWVSD